MKFNLNDYLMSHRDADDYKVLNDYHYPCVPRIKCKDGFTISVQASHGAYCRPRLNIAEWTAVECGFPSAVPELIMDYCEDSDDPTGTVYGYVPIGLVEQLIELHGGFECADVPNIKKDASNEGAPGTSGYFKLPRLKENSMTLTHKAIARAAGYRVEQHSTMYPYKYRWHDLSDLDFGEGFFKFDSEEAAYEACCKECGLIGEPK